MKSRPLGLLLPTACPARGPHAGGSAQLRGIGGTLPRALLLPRVLIPALCRGRRWEGKVIRHGVALTSASAENPVVRSGWARGTRRSRGALPPLPVLAAPVGPAPCARPALRTPRPRRLLLPISRRSRPFSCSGPSPRGPAGRAERDRRPQAQPSPSGGQSGTSCESSERSSAPPSSRLSARASVLSPVRTWTPPAALADVVRSDP